MTLPTQTTPVIDEAGLRAAEAWAQWYLGDRGWAGRIIGAYLNPEAAMENLKRERGDD